MARAEIERVEKKASGRVRRLREKVLVTPSLCLERGYLMTESYKETDGEPTVIRRAKALTSLPTSYRTQPLSEKTPQGQSNNLGETSDESIMQRLSY